LARPYKEGKELWKEFGTISIDDNECIETEFDDFPAGTSRYDIWRWFEEEFEDFIVGHEVT